MFRVTFFIDDKKLAAVLRDLASHHALEVHPEPVANVVQAKNGKITAAGSELGLTDMVEAVWQHFRRKEEFTPQEVKDFMKTSGWSTLSSSYATKCLIKAKLITAHGRSSATTYKVRA